MDGMMRALSVDEAAAMRKDHGRAFAEARNRCLHCQNSRACEEWLKTSERRSSPPEFCQAGAFFRQLSHRAHGAAELAGDGR